MLYIVIGLLVFLATVLWTVAVNIQTSVTGSINAAGTATVSDEGMTLANPTVLAAQAGTLTTRTDDNTGVLTLGASHGIITGQRVDLYWTGGYRYGITVGTVAGTSVPIDLGAGDVLPIATTAIKVGVPEETAFAVIGDDLSALIFDGSKTGLFTFADVSADIAVVALTEGKIVCWPGGASVNPLAGLEPLTVWISHSDTAAANTSMRVTAIGH